MPQDSAATRKRLLDAAQEEFARYGLAGARIDRIADAAKTNKRMIYVYYGSKEQLFETVMDRAIAEVNDTVPFTADDLPGYAGALFDRIRADPSLFRLGMWRQLERPEPTEAETASYELKAAALTSAQIGGTIAGLKPVDVLAFVSAMTQSWFMASSELHALTGKDPWAPSRLAEHREAIIEGVRRLLRQPGPPSRATPRPKSPPRTS